MGKMIDQNGDAFLFGQIKEKLEDSDILFINLEMLFSDNNPQFLHHAHESFRISDKRIETLKFLGADIVNIGTNHIKDFADG
ncbi:CapA family protein, partial [candidate division WOR-3 bacterium]|nr:CapA family protein [candidate division WOR-3 bacterium]